MSVQNKTCEELRAQAGPQKVDVEVLGVKKEEGQSSDQDESGNQGSRGFRRQEQSPTDSGPPKFFMGGNLVDEWPGRDFFEYGLAYCGQGVWCNESRYLDQSTKLADYKTCIYSLRFYFDEADGSYSVYETTIRVNLPWDYDGDYSGATEGAPYFNGLSTIGIVLLVTGSNGIGVSCTEEHTGTTINTDDDIAALLAMGAVPYWNTTSSPPTTVGRSGEPMVTVTFNRPSRGKSGTYPDKTDGNTEATGVPAYQDYALLNDGDDDGGPETSVIIEAALQVALQVAGEAYGVVFSGANYRLIVSSFSTGGACAARWLRYTSVPVHAFLDAEAPSDSLEKTVATECYDLFREYDVDELPASFNAEAWAAAAIAQEFLSTNAAVEYGDSRAYNNKFGPSLTGINLPPWELADEWLAEYRAYMGSAADFVANEVQYPVDVVPLIEGNKKTGNESETNLKLAMINGAFGHGYNSASGPVEGYIADVIDYWTERTLVDNLPYLPTDCIYVRINGKFDHVQPRHYLNRHAIRAVVAAQSSGNDVYMADLAYWEAMHAAGLGGTDPTDASTYASLDYDNPRDIEDIWPDFAVSSYRSLVRVDLARWAFDLV